MYIFSMFIDETHWNTIFFLQLFLLGWWSPVQWQPAVLLAIETCSWCLSHFVPNNNIIYVTGKCELTTLGGPNTNLDSSLFPPGLRINHSGEFVLLGSALGSPSFCHQHTKQRAMQTEPLLQALGQLPDSQTALMLLRHCASWSKLVYSSRVTPPPFHQDALKSYDLAVLQCLESCCTGALTPGACLQATLSTKSGGLGLRSIFRHSGAAYTASVLATSPICSLLLPAYNPGMDAIIANLNESLLAADHVALPPPPSLRQQDLSRAVSG